MIISLDKYKKTGHLKPEEELHIELTENGVFEYLPPEGSVYSKAIVTVNVTSIEIPSGNIEDGLYLIVSSDNRLVSSEGSGKLNAVQGSTFVHPDTSVAFDPVANPDTSIITDDKLKWSIVKDEDKYYIYNIVDNVKMYMAWDSSKYGNHAQIQTDVYPLHIDTDPENLYRYKISIIDNEDGRYLQRNNSNEYFAFYSSAQKGSVYLIKISDEVKEPEDLPTVWDVEASSKSNGDTVSLQVNYSFDQSKGYPGATVFNGGKFVWSSLPGWPGGFSHTFNTSDLTEGQFEIVITVNYNGNDYELERIIVPIDGWVDNGNGGDDSGDDNKPGVFFDDGETTIIIPYTGEPQELTIPFNMYGVENHWTDNNIQNLGVGCNIEVHEGVVEGYTHVLHIVVDPNIYNEALYDGYSFYFIDNDGNEHWYNKSIELAANPDSQLGLIEISSNYDGTELPSSAEGYEILFNVKNAEYQEILIELGNAEIFDVSFEPTDIDGYTHVAYITYNNILSEPCAISFVFTNGIYINNISIWVAPSESGGDIPEVDVPEAMAVSWKEFEDAEPNTEQWYELNGILTCAPQMEAGRWVLTDPNGEFSQTITCDDGRVVPNSMFINKLQAAEYIAFPGDGASIKIITLKHYAHPNDAGISNWIVNEEPVIFAGEFNGSPAAIYMGEVALEPEPL